jgi:hypothetical protein
MALLTLGLTDRVSVRFACAPESIRKGPRPIQSFYISRGKNFNLAPQLSRPSYLTTYQCGYLHGDMNVSTRRPCNPDQGCVYSPPKLYKLNYGRMVGG